MNNLQKIYFVNRFRTTQEKLKKWIIQKHFLQQRKNNL